MKAYRQRDRCRGEDRARVLGWLQAILANIVVDHLRKLGDPAAAERPIEGGGEGSSRARGAAGRFVLIGMWMMPAIHPAGGGPPTRMLQSQQGVVGAVALSPDGRHALTGGKDQVVRLWDVATGECLRTFEGHNSEVTCLRFSPDGTFALSGGFRETRIWHLDWDLGSACPSGWDEAARPHLESFIERQRPVEAELPLDSAEPWPWEARNALARVGQPTWTEAEFDDLMRRLGGSGFGWLDREMVRERLTRPSS